MGFFELHHFFLAAKQKYKEGDWRARPSRSWTREEVKERFHDFIDEDEHFEPSFLARTLGQAWDTFRLPPKERKYMQKLDANILIYCLLSFFLKTLDNSNVSNAYVSGMKEDLNLNGNERNLFTTFFNIGYLIGAIPSSIILNKVRPSIWIPLCELIWSGLVMAIAGAPNAKTIYGIRFVIGLFESVAYPGLAMVLGSWYKPSELSKRMELYDAAWAIASMFSGYIQAGVYTNMNGLAGFAGWRWLFIIDGCIGIPIALLGFYSVPDYPINTQVLYLSQLEKEYSYVRMEDVGRKAPKPLTIKRFFKYFLTWRPYGFLWPWVLFNICDTTGYFNLWLSSLGTYSVQQVNVIPSGGYALSLVSGYLSANISDRYGIRWPFIMHAVAWCFLGNLLLAIWDIPYGLKYFAFFCPNIGYALWGMMLAWSAEAFQDDTELRGMLPAVGSTLSYAMTAWLPVVIFPTEKAPKYSVGYQITTGLIVLEAMGVMFFLFMTKYEAKAKGRVVNKYGLAVDAEEADAKLDVGVRRESEELYGKIGVIDGVEPASDGSFSEKKVKEKDMYSDA
ncbi:major facilitator superfamily domain-containing protein [Dipodascopsis uninucleata]